jgi:Ser/Thr protein kinase RdoA (MazF antagonist)
MRISSEKLEGLLRLYYPFRRIRFLGEYFGRQSSVWKISADGVCYGVKCSDLTCRKRSEQMIRLCRILGEAGFRVAMPIETTDSAFCFSSEPHTFFVYEWLEGELASEATLCHAEAEEFGELLAGMHICLSQVAVDHEFKCRKQADRQETFEILEKLRNVLLERGAPEDDKLFVTVTEKMRLLEAAAAPVCVAEAYRESRLIVGDFQADNIVIDGDGGLGLIDLESFHFAPRIWDIAKASVFSFGKSPELIGEFLAGYHATLPLRESEVDVFVPLMLDYLLNSTWDFEEYILNNNARVDMTRTFSAYSLLASRAEILACDIKARLRAISKR